jgi:hypothetical protein
MKRFNRSLLIAAAVGTFGAGVGFVQAGFSKNLPGVQQLDEPKWKHPHMHRAIAALLDARSEIQNSEDIFRDRREEAISHIDRAIEQIHQGLREQGDDEAAAPGNSARQLDEHYPHLRHALDSLHEARTELDAAGKIFGGHRDDAIQHVDLAIHRVEESIR